MPSAPSGNQVERTKVCANSECPAAGTPLPWSAFHAKRKWPDGTTRQPHAYCIPCQREYTRDWHARRRKADPAWQEGRARSQRASLRSDPERYALSLERRRDWARRKYGYRRTLSTARTRNGSSGPNVHVDAAPFAVWLEGVKGDKTYKRLALELGMPERLVRGICGGEQAAVFLSTVDAALTAAGDVDALNDLYPIT